MSVITLSTDFGLKDGNVGAMKGVILGLAPEARLVDISHAIAPQDIGEAGFILVRSAPYFPAGTIHVVVVDPGVGTARRPLAARLGPYSFVGPDNGVITRLWQYAEKQGWPVTFVHLDRPEFWLAEVSHVFHGRDIFAPSAAHLSNGVPLHNLGTPIQDPIRLSLSEPQRGANGVRGEITYVDHFGNLAADIRSEHLAGWLDRLERISVHVGACQIHGLKHTFGERSPGELTALFGSTGHLIVAVVNGSAAERLGVGIGAPLEVVVAP